MLNNGREKVGIKIIKSLKAFIDYSQTTDNVYENLEDCDPTKKRRVSVVLDDMIANMEFNKKLSPIVPKLFLRGRKLNISRFFISQSYFKVLKTIRLNAIHYFIMKIPKERELQQIATNHSSDIDCTDFMKPYKGFTKEPSSFFTNDTRRRILSKKILL